jgi:hypothetical protein
VLTHVGGRTKIRTRMGYPPEKPVVWSSLQWKLCGIGYFVNLERTWDVLDI